MRSGSFSSDCNFIAMFGYCHDMLYVCLSLSSVKRVDECIVIRRLKLGSLGFYIKVA